MFFSHNVQPKKSDGKEQVVQFGLNSLCLNYKLPLDIGVLRTTIMVNVTGGGLSLWLVTLTLT